MRRKVIQLSESTLVVSLPHKWVEATHLTKGEEVELSYTGNALTVRTLGAPATKTLHTTTLDLADFGVLARRAIGALYKAGYDEVKISFANPLLLRTIHEVVQSSLIGFEVISEGKHSCVVKEISHINTEEFATIVRRIFWLLISLSEETAQNMTQPHKETTLQLIERDTTLNKFADFSRRCLNKGVVAELRYSNLLYYLVEQLERIGDEYKRVNHLLLTTSLQRKEIAAFFVVLHDFLHLFEKLFYGFNHKELRQFGDQYQLLSQQIDPLFMVCSKSEAQVLSLGQTILQHVYDLNGALMTYHV